ncbi:chorismate lyase [Shewanella yunxiaonensis]|uniref:Probable chorismate pyruvate-lyase n=1 Tax=Shewanella yunxiaonensis TaxID=2829809 RepID=A0ABX7YSU4_9GAMM|nr:chorismate lyase [Shewanella yunxiaonensis]QUN05818.1 chorismate lyase [Shewanella yunxiaonensis]
MNLTSSSFPFGDIIQWVVDHQVSFPVSPLKDWLIADGSLTQRLKQCCEQFEVQLLGERELTPLPGEWPDITQQLWIREALLCLDGRPWIFARTLAPLTLSQQQLQHLGNRPLGELLFSDSQCHAGMMEWGLAPATGNIQQLARALGQVEGVTEIWGRRRHFSYRQQPLVVAEFFLPEAVKRLPPLI